MNPYDQIHPPAPPPELALRRDLRKNANITGIATLLIFGVSMLLWETYGFTFPFIRSLIPGESVMWLTYTAMFFIFCITFWIPCVVMSRWLQIPAKTAYPMRPVRADVMISAIGICLGARFVGALLVERVSETMEIITGGLAPTMPSLPTPETTGVYILYAINIVVAPSIFEELLFRGVMLQALRRFGDHFAVVSTSILFALMHGNLMQGPYALLLGLLIGYFVIYTGSLWTGIAMHAANNFLSVLIEYFMDHMSDTAFETLAVVVLIVSVFMSVIGLVHLRSKFGSLFYLRRGNYPMTERRKHLVFFTSPFVIIAIGVCLYYIIEQFA